MSICLFSVSLVSVYSLSPELVCPGDYVLIREKQADTPYESNVPVVDLLVNDLPVETSDHWRDNGHQ